MFPLMLVSMALTALTLLLSLALLARRLRSRRRHGAAEAAQRRIEPAALGLLDGDPLVSVDPELEPALAESLSRLAPMVTGNTRASIAEYFESSGAVDRAGLRLADPRGHVRAATAAQLGDMCSERSVLPLLQALHDRDADVRLAAARSLGRLRTKRAANPLLHSLVHRHVPSAVATGALLAIGAASLPGIRRLLAHSHASARADGVELLGLLGNPADSLLVTERLADDAAAVRSLACQALRRLGALDAKTAVEAALADSYPQVRQAAAEALGQVGDRHSSAGLIHAAQTDLPDVARSAAESLARLAPGLAGRIAASSNASPHLQRGALPAAAGA
ncbi:MAG: hypothetical protein QOJ31_735 [Gaiellales bacterium]|jgi:HEAT repeat protein|nr:hypothetical protein [Gaiellales bacterium]